VAEVAHCGIDVFDFIKTAGVWGVSNSMWTVEFALRVSYTVG
jgi:hypothetical protein